jgi:hypothetical protein
VLKNALNLIKNLLASKGVLAVKTKTGPDNEQIKWGFEVWIGRSD